ncbi:MAG: hypothetical protein IB616_04525 [Methanosarcinales archaeon]|nr:MAG: hypothetical protein IB616_04525 [Methanosarcinales archaeon]
MDDSGELSCVYRNIQKRLNKKNTLNRIASCAWVVTIASFAVFYFYAIVMKDPILPLLFISLLFLAVLGIFGIKSGRIELTKKDRIIYHLQNINEGIIAGDFDYAEVEIRSCIVLLNNMIDKYQYLDFNKKIVGNLVKIEEILREYLYPVIKENNQRDPEKVSAISDYLSVASRQIYYDDLKEATRFDNKHFRRGEIPLESFRLSRFRTFLNMMKKYLETNSTVRYIFTFLGAFIVLLLLEIGMKGQDWGSIIEDILIILLISVGIAHGIEYFRKS